MSFHKVIGPSWNTKSMWGNLLKIENNEKFSMMVMFDGWNFTMQSYICWISCTKKWFLALIIMVHHLCWHIFSSDHNFPWQPQTSLQYPLHLLHLCYNSQHVTSFPDFSNVWNKSKSFVSVVVFGSNTLEDCITQLFKSVLIYCALMWQGMIPNLLQGSN